MNQPEGEETVFAEALRLAPEERAAYLARATHGRPELRQQVESLLAHLPAGEFLEQTAAPELRRTRLVGVPLAERPGAAIGPYKLLQQIGEGGCGVVYMAEQTVPVRRRVALKILKLGMDTRSVIARFEAERQALAMMDHPGIAKVFDAGATETGRPYFVMELVRGLKITDYCDEAKLPTRARLEMFNQVCRAIQHAHQKGIIHRDIKPSNILVAVNDGVAMPKVIDFGIAKAISGHPLTDKTLFTAFEQVIGTPAYMSPEQATVTNVDIDTRSDIYALGVLLYELLTGRTPFDSKELLAIGLDEMRRTIREKEPDRPSTRLGALPENELSTTAQRRGLEAPRLVTEIRGDLDWIVLKALEKDRARRYETANDLAADIQRHLNEEPVAACPPSRLYRLRKAVLRNKLAFAAGSAVGASLVVGLTLTAILFFRERAARQRADQHAEIAEAVTSFLQVDLLQQASSFFQAQSRFKPEPNLTVRDALERAAMRIGKRFINQPLTEAAVQSTIGGTFRGLGEVERAIPHLQRSLELCKTGWGPDDPRTLVAMRMLASAYDDAGRFDQARELYEEALKRGSTMPGKKDPQVLHTMQELAGVYAKVGRLDEAQALYEETLEHLRLVSGPYRRETLNVMNHLAGAYDQAGQLDRALSLYQETLKLMREELGAEDPYTQGVMRNLGLAYRQKGMHHLALPLFEEALRFRTNSMGSDYADVPLFMGNLAQSYHALARLGEAIAVWEKAVTALEARLGSDHTNTVAAMEGLAWACEDAGLFDKALPWRKESLRIWKAKSEADHPDTLGAMFRLGRCLELLRRHPEAETVYKEALDGLWPEPGTGPLSDTPLAGAILNSLSTVVREQGRLNEARTLAERAIGLYRRHLDWPTNERYYALRGLEAVLKELGEASALGAVRAEKLEVLRVGAGKGEPWALNDLAWILATSPDAAHRDGRSAVDFAEKAVAIAERRRPDVLDTLAAAWAEVGDFEKAAKIQREAISLCQVESMRDDLTKRLKLYESTTPYREP